MEERRECSRVPGGLHLRDGTEVGSGSSFHFWCRLYGLGQEEGNGSLWQRGLGQVGGLDAEALVVGDVIGSLEVTVGVHVGVGAPHGAVQGAHLVSGGGVAHVAKGVLAQLILTVVLRLVDRGPSQARRAEGAARTCRRYHVS